VYGSLFDRDKHVRPVELNPAVPLIESWDFGHLRPAVTWTQYPLGGMHVLGGVMGSDLHLERFVPEVIKIRQQWFPNVDPTMLWWTADPAGAAKNPHGSRTAFDILADFGIVPRHIPEANSPPAQDTAIQIISGYLDRVQLDGETPVFALNPRFLIIGDGDAPTQDDVLVDGFEVGLVWDEDRTFVTIHYSAIAHAPRDAAEQAGLLRNPAAKKRAVRELQARGIDTDIDRLSDADALRALQARLANQREKDEWRDVRRRQRDDKEPFRWNRTDRIGGRGGYPTIANPYLSRGRH
jgi:hypothetical protein